ncbi:S8/S53 family peptidase [Rhizorhabdus argentea]|uniref:S8/S53 family peptidase n=1 Tax=Rhizorhabdus argentea TaxID=1387174 RepID=UPI0030ED8190
MRFKSILLTIACLISIASPSTAATAIPLVAVIDSGVARTPELRDLVIAEYDLASAIARPSFRPRYDHGTMVATILARELNREVRMISFRIDDPSGCPLGRNPPCQSSPQPVAAAIEQAAALGVDAINISLALANDEEIVAAIAKAAARGIPVILAAGNDGQNHPGNLPMALAGYPKAVLVGALDMTGRPWPSSNRPDEQAGQRYRYAWQRGVDVPTNLASGQAVLGTGTSFAAPIETARLLAGTAMSKSVGASPP